ncbi:MAG: DHH family phosphoesterase [Nanoarchaeota archaeon]|nr:DHH family phosphoesterase [Nanoarchaeota archaeon]MBU1005520.1 DHH family phosphoesterase [Nanoarchaeota archaeon]MBU1945859.1 DHH family phosphoesterase [Nanoarchaeota archaeon]
MLGEKEIKQIREELDNCKNPLFFFHDDPDGLSSFLLLYRYVREGHGVVFKAKPGLGTNFLRKVEEYNPDKVFIVDIPIVEQEFIDGVKVPVIWIDHHKPLERHNVKYFNPRVKDKDDGVPATRICYEVVKQDMWIAAVGCIGDWHIPDFFDEFTEKYGWMVDKELNDPGKIYFETKLGKLVRIFSYILKGKTSDVNKCFKILTRIDEPDEILEQKSSRGKFVYRKFEKVVGEYDELLGGAIKQASEDPLLIYVYKENKMSFSGDLSNELIYRYPDKIVIVGREKSGEVRLSLRSASKPVAPILEKALIGVEGYGGGHEYACGANVKKDDFERFVENIRGQI